MKKTMLEVGHSMTKALYDIGAIDSVTMREFDKKCLPTVFASYLNTSPSTIRQWEQGEKHPRGTSLKLLNLVAEKGLAVLG